MVCRCAYGFGIIVNLIFVTFLTFELSLFWGLNTVKVSTFSALMHENRQLHIFFRFRMGFSLQSYSPFS